MFYKPAARQTPLLISARVMALIKRHNAIYQMAHRVQTESALPQLAHLRRRCVRNLQFWIHILQVPLERFTMEVFSQFHTLTDTEKQ